MVPPSAVKIPCRKDIIFCFPARREKRKRGGVSHKSEVISCFLHPIIGPEPIRKLPKI
ncbi:hypothetical protein EV217_1782 [Phyllobacterium myrsinacearum]|nr:hypothetical protein EV217_1782 [Phyllobacterium myrsinacearum]